MTLSSDMPLPGSLKALLLPYFNSSKCLVGLHESEFIITAFKTWPQLFASIAYHIVANWPKKDPLRLSLIKLVLSDVKYLKEIIGYLKIDPDALKNVRRTFRRPRLLRQENLQLAHELQNMLRERQLLEFLFPAHKFETVRHIPLLAFAIHPEHPSANLALSDVQEIALSKVNSEAILIIFITSLLIRIFVNLISK